MRLRPVVLVCVTLLLAIGSARGAVGRGTSPADKGSVTVTVEAAHPWIDSGLTVNKGQRLMFHATGAIRWGTGPDQVAGPEGHGATVGKLGAGGLIGRVGLIGKPFAIGNTAT